MEGVVANRYCPTENLRTWNVEEAVKIDYGEIGTCTLEATPSATIMSMFQDTVDAYPDHPALAYKENGDWSYVTYKEYLQLVRAAAKSLIKLGLTPFRAVAILGTNSKEWFIANYGAIFAGGIGMGLYTTSPPDTIAYTLLKSNANVCFVDTKEQLLKVVAYWEKLPKLKAIVMMAEELSPEAKDHLVFSWEEFMKLGAEISDQVLNERINGQYVNKCCSLQYTSGTTGKPKAVMLSHDNITYTCKITAKHVKMRMATETILSYLPLSHCSGQILDMYLPLFCASTTYFGGGNLLKEGTMNSLMVEIQPTQFLSVPQVFEKMNDKMSAALANVNCIKRKLVSWAKKKIESEGLDVIYGKEPTFAYKIAQKITQPIRRSLGLARVRYLYYGAGAFGNKVDAAFFSVGLPVMGSYGMGEICGSAILGLNVPDAEVHYKPGSIGHLIQGFDVRVEVPEESTDNYGEITVKGRNVFMGYMQNEDSTIQAFDSENRLRTGDIGCYKDGFLYLSGRKADVITVKQGDLHTDVVPIIVEDTLKSFLSVISQCMLIGDGRKFLTMLITLKAEFDMSTMTPTVNLTSETIDWCKLIGSKATKVSDVTDHKDELVDEAVFSAIRRVNLKRQLDFTPIQRFTILPIDFSLKGGELGPTLKVKRKAVAEKYAEVIERMYE